jgi:3',5'-cyclic AMP phosphodiesterase CpdA
MPEPARRWAAGLLNTSQYLLYTRTMIIAQISDTHIDLDSTQGAVRRRDLKRCVDDINGLDPLPDVVIHTGDLTQRGRPDEYDEAKKILRDLRAPLYVAAGNRDDRGALRTAFPADGYLLPDSPFVQYCVDEFPVRLMILDTLGENTNKGDFCAARADSLGAALAGDMTKPTAVFMHHPPFEVVESKYPFQFESRDAIARMGRVLNRHGRVVRAFCGHTHRATAGTIGDVPVSSTPSVAVDLRLGDFPDAFRSVPLYQIHKFDATQGFVSELRAAGHR